MGGYTVVGVPPPEIVMVKSSNKDSVKRTRRSLPSKAVRTALFARMMENIAPRHMAKVRENQTRKKDTK